MKRVLILCIIAFGSIPVVGTLPYGYPRSLTIFEPSGWSVRETPTCPYGYQCYYGNAYVPSITINLPVWVFGVTNNAQCGGILNFRRYPDTPCVQSCIQEIPVEYTAEVIYVPSTGGSYNPEDVCLTHIPRGRYVVTSPSFSIFRNTKLWWFPDDGYGPQIMSAIMKTDKEKYGREDTAQIFIQVTSETQEFIQVDNIFGVISLPDNTEKTITMEDWSWNEEEERYQYVWDFTNDQGVSADPKEGFYLTEMVVKKKYYKDVRVQSTFDVCYHVGIDLAFDKDPPEYTLFEEVKMTVSITDEQGSPLDSGIDSVLLLPDGNIDNLLWTPIGPGTYITIYMPDQEGQYSITVEAAGDTLCYLEDITATFTVKECEEALLNLEIGPAVVNEPVTFILTVTDKNGNYLSDARIDSEVYLPDCSLITLSWEEEDGIYHAEYTPTEIGVYEIRGTVTVLGETCFRGFFFKPFVVEEKKLPDLVILNDDIELFPEPELGNTVTISVTIRNMGNADAECFWVIILINDEVVHREPIGLLAAGESVTLTYEWTVLYSGGNIIEVIVDPWRWMV